MANEIGRLRGSAAVLGCVASLFFGLTAIAPHVAADPADPNVPQPPVPVTQPAGAEAVAAPNGVPHLASPDALPPGSTMDPSAKGNDGPNVSYLKDLYQAVQNHEISGKEALLMGLAQRGMNTPYPQHPPGPNVPTSPAGDPAPEPPPPPPPMFPWLPPPASSDAPTS